MIPGTCTPPSPTGTRPGILEHDEVHLAAVGIPEVAQLHGPALGVLHEVAVLEEVARDHVLEARPGGLDEPEPADSSTEPCAGTGGSKTVVHRVGYDGTIMELVELLRVLAAFAQYEVEENEP